GSPLPGALVVARPVALSTMRGLAAWPAIVGVVSGVGALTLLPALLGLLGDRANALRVPVIGRNLGRSDAAEGRLWRGIVDAVLRRPAASLVLRVAVMLALAVPLLGLHLCAI